MKCSDGLSKMVSIILKRYKEHMKLVAYMALFLIIFFHILLVPCFFPFYIWLYVLCVFVFSLRYVLVFYIYLSLLLYTMFQLALVGYLE